MTDTNVFEYKNIIDENDVMMGYSEFIACKRLRCVEFYIRKQVYKKMIKKFLDDGKAIIVKNNFIVMINLSNTIESIDDLNHIFQILYDESIARSIDFNSSFKKENNKIIIKRQIPFVRTAQEIHDLQPYEKVISFSQNIIKFLHEAKINETMIDNIKDNIFIKLTKIGNNEACGEFSAPLNIELQNYLFNLIETSKCDNIALILDPHNASIVKISTK